MDEFRKVNISNIAADPLGFVVIPTRKESQRDIIRGACVQRGAAGHWEFQTMSPLVPVVIIFVDFTASRRTSFDAFTR
jgi:hypothetical protein